jgi:proline dehydrogenase
MEVNLKEQSKEDPSPTQLDFENTEIAFSSKSNSELKRVEKLFLLMNNHLLVKIFSSLGMFAVKWRLPFADLLVRNTIFKQFCGGENLMECQKTIDKLYRYDTLAVLDYGVEAKNTDEEFESVVLENLRAIEMAASNNSVPVVVIKISGLVQNEILEKINAKIVLNAEEKNKYDALISRVDKICDKACEYGIGLFIDAEESWIQDPIDQIAMEMMEYYNKEKVIVYNTYQLYRHDKLVDLQKDHKVALEKKFLLGAKLVRGAYMEKERKRADEMNYKSPIQISKENTDSDYNKALVYCFENLETISFCCASHNATSNMLCAELIEKNEVEKNHPHINFCQLQGMSDNITFNLAKQGYNSSKYVVYGPVKEVLPYLVRRAQENTSVTGEVGRELSLIKSEIKRRRI